MVVDAPIRLALTYSTEAELALEELLSFGSDADLHIGSSQVVMSNFLRFCLSHDPSSLELQDSLSPEVLRKRFINAGRIALEALTESEGWTQINISLPAGPSPRLYSQISSLFETALAGGTAINAFFVHKPPGMRVRVQAAGKDCSTLAETLQAAGERFRQQNLVTDFWPEIYEPETALFGGAVSMGFVHKLFTIDTRFWLAQHARGASAMENMVAAMLLFRSFLASFGIVDWEDLGVWEKVRDRTGRAIGNGEATLRIISTVGTQIVHLWNTPSDATASLSAATREAMEQAIRGIGEVGAAWRNTSFHVAAPGLSHRAAAALYAIFLFNRAGLSIERQMILAETLAARNVLD